MMSAPGREVLRVDRADDVRAREHEDVAVALQIARMCANRVAAEVRFRQLVPLDHRPHRAVEDEDPAFEQRSQRVEYRAVHSDDLVGVGSQLMTGTGPAPAWSGRRPALFARGCVSLTGAAA